MPLASARAASEKRAAAVKAERERQERRDRISFPKSTSSTRTVTRDGAKRRRNSRAISEEERSKKQVKSMPKEEGGNKSNMDTIEEKENQDMIVNVESAKEKENQGIPNSPDRKDGSSNEPLPVLSPTPYWKVAAERRKSKKFSPPTTRSAKKKKARREDESRIGGIALTFSPPDQRENAKRENEELETRMKDRDRRVREAQEAEKRLLIYSPKGFTCNHNFDEDQERADYQNQELEDDNKQSTTTTMIPASVDKQALEAERAKSQQLEAANSTLESTVSDLELTLAKNQTKTEELQVANSTLESSVSKLESTIAENHTVMKELKAEKSKMEFKLSKLETTIATNQKEHEAEKVRLGTQMEESVVTIQGLEDNLSTLTHDKSALVTQVATLEDDLKESKALLASNKVDSKTNEDLTSQISKLKKQMGNMQTQIKRLEAQLKESTEAKTELGKVQTRLEDEVKRLEGKLKESAKVKKELAKLQSTKNQLEAQLTQVEAEAKDFKDKEAERKSTINCELGALKAKLEQQAEELRKVRVESSQMREELAQITQEKEDLQNEKEALHKKHKLTKETMRREKEDVEESLGALRAKLEKQAVELHKVKEEFSEKSEKLARVEHRLSTSDVRENELLRKLEAGDKIRAALHNRVTQLAGNIRVFVRVRPSIPGEEQRIQATESKLHPRHKQNTTSQESPFHYPCAFAAGSQDDDITKRVLEIKEPARDRGGLSDRRKHWRFPFDAIFPPRSSQEDVWEAVSPLVQSAIDGFPVCIFAYGQTGSGKTFTMLGEDGNEGVITRSVNMIFNARRELEELSKGTTQVDISIELLEIYNEQVRDLLAPNSGPNGREVALKVTKENAVVGNIQVPVASEKDVMDVLALAAGRRVVKGTQSNAESSRSHMVFTLHFAVTMKNGIKRSGRLNICDLAGSERLSKSGANSVGGDLMKETKAINSSLSVLSNCIEKLQAGASSVPFRESKLTFLLSSSLGGNSKTLAIICCNPHAAHFHESLCSVRFAEKVSRVELKAMGSFKIS